MVNTLSTVGGLCVLIEVFGPISGAHFNPAVPLVMAMHGQLPPRLLPWCVVFGRMFTESFAGIAPASVRGFAAAQLVGARLAVAINRAFATTAAATSAGATHSR